MKRFMFVIAALILVGLTSAFAQPATSGDIVITVNVAATPLAITAGDLTVDGVTAGQTAVVVPDGAGAAIIPTGYAGTVTATMTETTIAGDPSAEILVSFGLPSMLTSPTGQANIQCSFNGTSGIWGAPTAEANYFDPTKPTVMQLDQTGAAGLYLGGIFKVGAGVTVTEAYVGDALVTASYTGN